MSDHIGERIGSLLSDAENLDAQLEFTQAGEAERIAERASLIRLELEALRGCATGDGEEALDRARAARRVQLREHA